jgi:hypothetical protein
VRRSYEVAGIAFGVRTNSEAFAGWLDDALDAYRIDEEMPSYYSVLIAETGKPGKRFHLVYAETRVLVRSRSLDTVARALLSQFEFLLLPERDDAIYAEMTVVASNGRRALVPPLLLPLLESFSRRDIERSGLVLPATTTVAIDPSSGDIVPMPPVLDVAAGALEELARSETHEAEPRVTVDRPFAADAVVTFGDTMEALKPVSKAETLYRAASHSLNLGRIGGEIGLEGLRKTVERAPCFELGAGAWDRAIEGLVSVLRP